jgi:hypothetical protein
MALFPTDDHAAGFFSGLVQFSFSYLFSCQRSRVSQPGNKHVIHAHVALCGRTAPGGPGQPSFHQPALPRRPREVNSSRSVPRWRDRPPYISSGRPRQAVTGSPPQNENPLSPQSPQPFRSLSDFLSHPPPLKNRARLFISLAPLRFPNPRAGGRSRPRAAGGANGNGGGGGRGELRQPRSGRGRVRRRGGGARDVLLVGRRGGAGAEAAAAAAPQARGVHGGAPPPPRVRPARGPGARLRRRTLEPLQPPPSPVRLAPASSRAGPSSELPP